MLPAAVRTLLRSTPTVAPVPHRALLAVTGSQAAEFLSGIVASTPPPSPDCHFYTALLHAQGRVLYDAFIHAYTSPEGKNGYLLEYDSRPSEAPPLLAMLKRYVLRSKVKLRDVTEEYDVWAAWGSDAEKVWETPRQWNGARSGVVEPMWGFEGVPKCAWGRDTATLRDRRAMGMGHRLVVRKGDRPRQSSTHDNATSKDYLLHRILHGVPEGTTDIVPMNSFPMDSNLDIMGALDFRKGCYVGQELTVRTYHTGTLRKRIFPVQISAVEASTSNTADFDSQLDIRAVTSSDQPDGAPRARPRGTGKLLSSCNGVGLALLRLEHVLAFEDQKAVLEFDFPTSADGSPTRWTVSPWRPEWWPSLPSNSE